MAGLLLDNSSLLVVYMSFTFRACILDIMRHAENSAHVLAECHLYRSECGSGEASQEAELAGTAAAEA